MRQRLFPNIYISLSLYIYVYILYILIYTYVYIFEPVYFEYLCGYVCIAFPY
jgi:hypothetical protein